VTVLEGTNRVLGVGPEALEEFRTALSKPLRREPYSPERWDGDASIRAADAIIDPLRGAIRSPFGGRVAFLRPMRQLVQDLRSGELQVIESPDPVPDAGEIFCGRRGR
jgi:hypothetical protein